MTTVSQAVFSPAEFLPSQVTRMAPEAGPVQLFKQTRFSLELGAWVWQLTS